MLSVWLLMDRQTPAQESSRELAEAVFADPELREQFETMASETATREPIPDDFTWLSRGTQQQDSHA